MPTELKGWIDIIAVLGTWAGAGATIFAVWFLLRLQRQERPKLLLVIDPEDAGALQYVRSEEEAFEELWIRVAVRNDSNTPAKDVQIRLGGVFRGEASAQEGRPHLWFKAANLNSAAVSLLPRGITQYFDIACLFSRPYEGIAIYASAHLVIAIPKDLDEDPWVITKRKIESSADNRLDLGGLYTLVLWGLTSNGDASQLRVRLRIREPQGKREMWPYGKDNLRDAVDFVELPTIVKSRQK